MVYVWKYIAVHNGDICHDKDLAGEGADGGDGHSGAVSEPALSGTGKCESGNVDPLYLCMHGGGLCHEHIFHAHTDDHGCRGCDLWDTEKECEICSGTVPVLYALSAAGSVLSGCKIAAQEGI